MFNILFQALKYIMYINLKINLITYKKRKGRERESK